MSEEVQDPFSRIDVHEAQRMMQQGGVRVIDVREPHEYAGGHVPQAELIPLGQILARPQDHIRNDEKTIFVCGVGQRSAVAAEMAAAVGATDIYNMEGGTSEWIRQGLPTE
ncbi:MAG: rhodanese-like domain-containing protein [Chloroflexota bacterium]